MDQADLLQAEERDLLNDIAGLPQQAVMRPQQVVKQYSVKCTSTSFT
jgi:hypothetical protein